MNTLAGWLVSAPDDPAAPVVWLLVKLTVFLAIGWLLHVALGRSNPRWRVLLWRSTAAGAVVLVTLFFLPPFVSWPLLPPLVPDDRTVGVEATPAAAPLVGTRDAATPRGVPAPSVARHPGTDSAGDRTAVSRRSPRDGAAVSPAFPKSTGSSAHEPEPSHLATRGVARSRSSFLDRALAIWWGGVLAGMVWTAFGLRRLARIRRRSIEVPPWVVSQADQAARGLGLERACQVRRTRDLQSPCLVGAWVPMILLPERQCEAAARDELPSILAHELAHLRGGDLAWNALLHGLSILFWFHPLCWRVRTAHADACDAVSDAIAADYVGDADIYGRTLARLTLRATAAVGAVGLAMARPSCTRRRIEAVRRHVFRAGLPRRRATWVVVATAVATFLLGSLGLDRSNAQPARSGAALGPGVPATSREKEPQGPAREPGVVTGEVVDAKDGTPVAGAQVLLRDKQLHRAKTDEKGRFRFAKIARGQYRIWAYKEGLASRKEQLLGREAPASRGALFPPIRLPMSPGKQVKLTVASAETGRPIEGADVRLSYPDRRQETTGKDGVAVVPALLPEKYEITVLAPGHAREARDVDLSAADQVTSLSFSLPPGGVVYGTVTGEDGKPLADANVNFHTVGTSRGYFGDSPKTDERGRYRNPYLPLKTPIAISFSREDHLPAKHVVTLTDQQREQQLDIALARRPPGGSIAGIVTDRAGKPIPGATVGNYGNRSDEKREVTTDAQGRFLLHDLLKTYAGPEIVVRARGFAPALRKVEPGPADAPADASVQLGPGHSLRGRVENAAGEPIQGAYVAILSGQFPPMLQEFAQTDADGRFEFDSLAADSKFRISADGYSARENASLPLDGDGIVSVKLEPMGVLRGRVVDSATGQAIGHFKVRIDFSRDRRAGDFQGGYDPGLSEPGRTFQAPDGTFTLPEIPNRLPVEVIVEAEGYQRSVLPRVVAQPVGEATVLDIRLKKADPSQHAGLTGTLIDHRRNPVAGVQLRLIVSSSASTGDDDNRFHWGVIDSGQLGQQGYVDQYLSAVSDARGRFEFRDLLPGKFVQLAYWGPKAPKGRSLAFAKTKPGATQTVTIEVPEPASLSGSFDAKAFPNSGAIQLLQEADPFHSYQSEITVGQTEFRFENLPPGRYQLAIVSQPERHKGNPQLYSLRPLAARKLTVEPGGTYKVRFTKDDRVDRPAR